MPMQIPMKKGIGPTKPPHVAGSVRANAARAAAEQQAQQMQAPQAPPMQEGAIQPEAPPQMGGLPDTPPGTDGMKRMPFGMQQGGAMGNAYGRGAARGMGGMFGGMFGMGGGMGPSGNMMQKIRQQVGGQQQPQMGMMRMFGNNRGMGRQDMGQMYGPGY